MLTAAILVLGTAFPFPKGPESKPGAKRPPPAPQILYVGGSDYKAPEGEPEPLLLRMEAGGRIIADKPVEITDDDLKTSVPKYCDGHPRVSIVIGVMEPDKSTLQTIRRVIERVRKHVPAKTAATFVIEDYDI